MTHVLAAVEGPSAAAPVLDTAAHIASGLGVELRLVHGQPWSPAVQEQVAARGLALELVAEPADKALLAAAADTDPAVAVAGIPLNRGRVSVAPVRELIERLGVPVVLVPAHAPLRREPRRILFSVDGSTRVSAAARPVIAMYVAAGFEVHALHVYDPATVPQFHDGPEDEQVWRDEFVAEHFTELDVRLTTRPGPLVPVLLEIVQHQAVDIIALPAHPEPSKRADAVLREVLEAAVCPVVLIPMSGHPGAGAHASTPGGRLFSS